MEKPLRLKETEDTPEVVLDKQNNEFKISGKSLPEDASEFYRPILQWMKTYVKDANPSTEFEINLLYFNSSSVKQVLDLLSMLEEILKAGKKIKIVWCYSEDDDLMEAKGLDFKDILNVPFEMKVC